jgi:hypothetical protein
MSIEIDNDSGEIRVDGYEYAATKVKVKDYYVSSEISQTGNSADLRLTDSDGYMDNVTFTGGTNVTIVRTDANKITISATANDTNTTYGISAESNATPKSADLRLTGSDASTDNVTLVGGTNVTITRNDANTITFSATDIDTNTKYSVSAESSQTGNSTDIRLTDTDGYTDNVTITGGSNVSIVRNNANQLTVSSSYTGFGAFTDGYNTANADQAIDTINFNAGAGIKLTVNPATDTLLIDNDGVRTFNGFNGDISYNAFGAITDGYNTAIADWPMDTFQINSGAGISFIVDGYTDSATLTNTGVTQINQGSGITVSGQTGNVTVTNAGVRQAIAGTGISVSSGTGLVTINNTGVTAITAGTGITTSGSGNITVNNDGVTTFNTAKGAITYNSFANISDGYNTASADQASDTFTIFSGTGISAIVNGLGDNINISNTGVTQFNGGTGNISYYSFGTISDGYNVATADQANDSILFIPGTGIGVIVNTPGDNVTISNTGVTSLNGGTGAQYQYATISDGSVTTTPSSGHTSLSILGTNGIKTAVTPDTVTVSMSQTTLVKGSDSTINNGGSLSVLATNTIPINTTVELSGIIMFSFAVAPPAVNTFDITLSTGSGTIGANTSKAVIGFTCHAGVTAGSPLEASKQTPSATYPQQIVNTNIHVIRFSGVFQTDGTTPNSIIINMKNNCLNAGENLIIYAKSFIKYNVI